MLRIFIPFSCLCFMVFPSGFAEASNLLSKQKELLNEYMLKQQERAPSGQWATENGKNITNVIVHKGYLPIRNKAKYKLSLQYMGTDQKCVFVPNKKVLTLKPNERVLFPVHFREPCDVKLKFRVMKIQVKQQEIPLLRNFIPLSKVKQALRNKKYPTKVL